MFQSPLPAHHNAASGRLRGALVVAETALAFLLLTGAGLKVQAFFHVRNLDPGFRPENVLTARTALPSPRYDDTGARTAFFDRALAGVQGLPGVVSAGYITYLPLTMAGGTNGFILEGKLDLNEFPSWITLFGEQISIGGDSGSVVGIFGESNFQGPHGRRLANQIRNFLVPSAQFRSD